MKNDHMINCAMFSVSDLNMTKQAMLFDPPQPLTFRLEVANEKPLLTTKPASI